jgi:tRNA splicing endonuclease
MIEGNLKGRRVLVENEADASTLRNKGFLGHNLGQRLSLDLITSLHLLLRKRLEIRRGQDLLTPGEIKGMMTDDERKIAVAYHFLKDKGMKPVVRGRNLVISNSRVLIFQDNDTVDFSSLIAKSCYLCIEDREENCLLYSVNRLPIAGSRLNCDKRGSKRGRTDLIKATFEGRGMRVESGFKYGCQFRIYENNSSHAKFLMTTADKVLLRDIVARVRIAQSVRKVLVQAAACKKRNEFRFFAIRWVRV